MTETYGLEPPWDTDQQALNAAEILADQKAKTGRFRAVRGQVINCDCSSQRRRLVRMFVGEDDLGEVLRWLLVPAHGAAPARAVHIPQTMDEPSVKQITVCPRCKEGWLLVATAEHLTGHRLHSMRHAEFRRE